MLRCSFCLKPQQQVRKLISSPSGIPRAYICDQCVTVSAAILEDDLNAASGWSLSGRQEHPQPSPDAPPQPTPPESPLRQRTEAELAHLVDQLLQLVQLWITREASGADSSAELAQLRNLARVIFVHTDDQ